MNAELTIVSSLKHKNTQPFDIFNRENPKHSEPRRGLDFIALMEIVHFCPYLGLVSLHGWQFRVLLALTKKRIIYLDMKAGFLI
jgi:hypothetical protein